uniref:Olfactory receptor n=1 Tax=Sphaeramia orbicularis TaxID=375764 RepID=A0A672ZF89_9TELE
MSANASSDLFLSLEKLDLPNAYIYPAFLSGLLTYIFIMFCNLLVLVAIAASKKLHKPMFILLFNLPVSHMITATAFFPHFVLSIVTKRRLIPPPACITQAFLVHLCGTGNLLILSAMAYDRYVAICRPLRYNAVMTPHNLVKIIILIWFIMLVSILIGLTVRLSRCRSVIKNAYCDNASLFKLSCEDVSINDIYGLFFTVLLFSCSMGGIAVTYFRIALVCWIKKNKELNNKALQTCASHLVLYLIMLWSGFLTIILHRFPNYPDLRKIAYVLFHVIPANLNPIIYGMQTRLLRERIIHMLKRKVTPT